MNKVTVFRNIIVLFNSYGISLFGNRKRLDFCDQLRMDKIFVYGLIFELECLLRIRLEEDWESFQTPETLINCFMDKFEK
ncbi:acyl carrier protein [Negadavirga shengliensis]|uniref:Acyl carrier protein n=1 Tax=Negadavirga shengliensis TaxID=1389218 RepID=A0ABV9T2H7_9BACT